MRRRTCLKFNARVLLVQHGCAHFQLGLDNVALVICFAAPYRHHLNAIFDVTANGTLYIAGFGIFFLV